MPRTQPDGPAAQLRERRPLSKQAQFEDRSRTCSAGVIVVHDVCLRMTNRLGKCASTGGEHQLTALGGHGEAFR